MQIKGVHHIKLTVTSLDRSKEFYEKIPGFKLVADHQDFLMFYNGNIYIGLTTHDKEAKGEFNEKTVGLDHVAFEVGSIHDLNDAFKFLDDNEIPHSEIEKLSNGTNIVVFRDPDNIQLEFCYREA